MAVVQDANRKRRAGNETHAANATLNFRMG
jgi:hypothetical protein